MYKNRCKTKVTRPTSMSLWKRQRLGLIYHKIKLAARWFQDPGGAFKYKYNFSIGHFQVAVNLTL